MRTLLIALIVASAVAASSYYFIASYGPQSGQLPSYCPEMSRDEIDGMIQSKMTDEGYEKYEVVDVSTGYCDEGVTQYNINTRAVIDQDTVGQHNRTVRLQIRHGGGESRIYEVVLANPARAST